MTRGFILRLFIIAIFVLITSSVYASSTLTLSLESPELGDSAAKHSSTSQAKKASPKTTKANVVKVGRVGTVRVAKAPIYRAQSYTSRKYATVKSGTPLAIVREENGWYGVMMSNGGVGWIPAVNVSETGYDLVAKQSDLTRGAGTSRGGALDRDEMFTNTLVRTAAQAQVARYLYGGTNPASGMDCSAFVRMIFKEFSINLPRTSREQATVGTTIPLDQLQPGDRLYFACRNPYIDHCGIYAGNGYFVHCSASRNGVGVDSLSSSFFARSLVVAKRS
ncbi:MAG: NlpC/P60 family protein [Armatimonadota bacterium]|nr:NlpC/P60 family protein [bacterium]